MKFLQVLVATICLSISLSYVFLYSVQAQDSETKVVSATITIGVVSVEITPSDFNYGIMPFGGTKESFDVINISGQRNIRATVSIVPTDLYIKGANTNAWILADQPGSNQYIHRFGTTTNATTRPPSYTDLSTSNKVLATNLQPEESTWLGLRISTPTSGTTSQQSAGVIITAFHAD